MFFTKIAVSLGRKVLKLVINNSLERGVKLNMLIKKSKKGKKANIK